MTVNRYLFQSPSSSQVQIGRPDPSAKQEQTNTNTSQQLDTFSKKAQPVHETQVKSENIVQNISADVSEAPLLDVYA